MDREQKSLLVTEFKKKFADSKIALLTDFRGLDVASITKLRKELRAEKVEYKVVKNTLARVAIKGTELEEISKDFKGPVGVAFGYGDPAAPAKVLVNFAKANDKLTLKIGSMSGKKLTLEQIKALALLPSRDELLSQLASVFVGPLRGMACCMAGVPRGFLNCLVALKEQKEKQGN